MLAGRGCWDGCEMVELIIARGGRTVLVKYRIDLPDSVPVRRLSASLILGPRSSTNPRSSTSSELTVPGIVYHVLSGTRDKTVAPCGFRASNVSYNTNISSPSISTVLPLFPPFLWLTLLTS